MTKKDIPVIFLIFFAALLLVSWLVGIKALVPFLTVLCLVAIFVSFLNEIRHKPQKA